VFPKRGAIALGLTAVALILLLNFKTPDQFGSSGGAGSAIVESAPAGTSGSVATPAPDSTTSDPSTTSSPTATAAPATKGTSGAADATVTGPEVDMRFGPVQVQVTISGGRITDVVALQLPSGGHSGRISQRAEPVLQEEALQAQSASIDTVSGATYTSDAYEQSLQAALDQAGF